MIFIHKGEEMEKSAVLEKEELQDQPVYEKPKLEERKGMAFPREIAEKFNAERFCIQCSG